MCFLQDLLSQTREKQAATLSEVTWRGRTVQVKVETVRLFLLSMTDAEKELETADTTDSKISIYETLLKQCIEAQQALRDALQEDTVSRDSANCLHYKCMCVEKGGGEEIWFMCVGLIWCVFNYFPPHPPPK